MSDEVPASPEWWRDVITDTVAQSGHEDEVIVSLESTMTGWCVSIHPVRNTPATNAPEAQ